MSGERSEAATPRRLAKLHSEGRSPRSPELTSAIALVASCTILQAWAASAGLRLQQLFTGTFSDLSAGRAAADGPQLDMLWAQQALGRGAEVWLLSLAPLLIALPLLALGVGFAQGAVFTFKSMLTFDRVNPLSGFKRIFSMQSLVGLIRTLAKIGIVTWATQRAVQNTMDHLSVVQYSTSPQAMLQFLGGAALDVAWAGAEVLIVLAVADYAYQRWSFIRGARMSKDDVKQEQKQQEGDPLVKSQIRARQRRMARARRQLLDVPNATVVVTNPTHFAVALQYDRTMPSPRVVAKGADLIAQRIKQVAAEAGVPVVENKPLAQGLFKSTEIGDDIPIELYQAVAEVLAFVFSLRRRRM